MHADTSYPTTLLELADRPASAYLRGPKLIASAHGGVKFPLHDRPHFPTFNGCFVS
jgi:hypothetical protein